MAWIRWLLVTLLTLSSLLGAVVVWLANAELSFLKPAIEDYVRNVTGREFTVAGPLRLDLGKRAVAIAEDVSLGDSDWSAARTMLHIDYLRVEVELPSLIAGPVVVNLIEITGAQAGLVEREDGDSNWHFGEPANATDDPTDWIVPEAISIQDVAINYSAPHLQHPLEARITTLRQQHRTTDDHLAGELAGTINGRNVEVRTDLGPFANLLAGEDIDYDIVGRIDTLAITASGTIDNLAKPARPAIAFSLDGPNVDDLTSMLGVADYGEGGLSLLADLVPVQDSLTLSVQGQLAGLSISATGSASGLQALRDTTFHIDANGPNLGRFLALFGIAHVPETAFEVSGGMSRNGSLLRIDELTMTVGDTYALLTGSVGGFPNLDAADLQLSVRGTDLARYRDLLGLPAGVSGPFELQVGAAQAADGSDTVQLAIKTPLVNLTAGGPLGDPPDYSGSRFTIAASGASLSGLVDGYAAMHETARQFVPAEPFAFSADLVVSPGDFMVENARAAVGNAHLAVAGNLSRNADLAGSRLSFTAHGTDLEDLIADAANIDVQASAFEIAGNVALVRDTLRIDEVRITGIAGARIRLDADIGWPISTPLEGKFLLEASGLDATTLPIQLSAFRPAPAPFDLTARGSWQRGRVLFETTRARLGQAVFSWQGTLDGLPDLSATDLRLVVDVPDLAALGLMNDVQLPAQPFTLDAHFDGTIDTFEMDRMTGRLGGTSYAGKLMVDVGGLRPHATAQLDFPVLDLRDWIDKPGDSKPDEPTNDDGKVIPDYQMPLEQLAKLDGSVNITASQMRLHNVTFTKALLAAELDAGALRISELDMVAPTGRLDGTLHVEPAASEAANRQADVHFTFAGQDLQLNLTGTIDDDLITAPVYDLDIDLQGRGTTLRELAATLNGHARLLSDGGRIHNSSLGGLFGGFSRDLISAVNPFSNRDAYTTITCAVAAFNAQNGVLTTAPRIIAQSKKLNIIAAGAVNLATEKITFTFNTRARKGTGLSASQLANPYIRITGSLTKPALSFNPRSTAISGGAAAVTGGMSILAQAVWDRTFRSKDPCSPALQEARDKQ